MRDKKPILKDLSIQELHKLSIKIANELSIVKKEILRKRGYSIGKLGLKEYEALIVQYPNGGCILDHGYSLHNSQDGSRFLVGEPYTISKDNLRKLVDDPAFIDITANSLHYPGATFSVRFKSNKRQGRKAR